MKLQDNNFALVIVSNNHNPTVVTEHFLLKTGIINDSNEIDRNRYFVTPALTQILINSRVLLVVEPDKLNIQSPQEELPFRIGQLYCSNLIHIVATAVGYNFHTIVYDFDIDNWRANFFKSVTYANSIIQGAEYTYSLDNVICTVQLKFTPEKQVLVVSNFHRETLGVTLGEIEEDFLSKSKNFLQHHRNFIFQTFHQFDYAQEPNQ